MSTYGRSPEGGKISVLDLREALVLPQPAQIPTKIPTFWKVFLIVLLAAFSLISLPRQGAVERSLTEGNLLELVNADRSREGVRPLHENTQLQVAAEEKARHILQNGYFAHTSPEGVEPWDFIRGAGFAYSFAGENLAINYTNSYELEKDFLRSPGHRDNLLSPLYSETGIAVISGTFKGEPAIVTVQMFASPAGQSVAIK